MRKLLALCALLLLGAAAFAADFAGLKPEGYVSDYARVIEPAARAPLEQYCSRVEALTGAEIAVVTLPTLGGEPLEDVAVDIYSKWGIGKKGKDEGVLLLLVTGDRRMRLEVGYGLEPVIPDGAAGEVLRAMRPSLREGRYGEAVAEALNAVGARIAQAKGVSLDAPLPRRRRAQPANIPWPMIVGGLAILFWMFGAARGTQRGRGGSGADILLGMLAGQMLGRSIGRGGGGFGGFDSGDTFGGFGGGSSGGGGASSSW